MCILDSVCGEDAALVFRAFPCIKALFGRLSSDLSFARVLLPIAQFYLNHGVCARRITPIGTRAEDKFFHIDISVARLTDDYLNWT